MKTEKPDMTIKNAVKNLIGFALIVMIVPPFFSAIIRTNQPSQSTREIDAAANRIDASLDSNKPQKAVVAAPVVTAVPPVVAAPTVDVPVVKTATTLAEVVEQEEALEKELEHEKSVGRGALSFLKQDEDGEIELTLEERQTYVKIAKNSIKRIASIAERANALTAIVERINAGLPVNQEEIQ